MERILPRIREHFLAKSEELNAFARQGTRVEGWFKGEMIVLLDRLKTQRLVDDFDREPCLYPPNRKLQVDFRVTLAGALQLVQIRSLCITRPRKLRSYFREDSDGLPKDMWQLSEFGAPESKWVFTFIFPRPDVAEWQAATAGLPADLGRWTCVTQPSDYPDHLFLSLWTLPR